MPNSCYMTCTSNQTPSFFDTAAYVLHLLHAVEVLCTMCRVNCKQTCNLCPTSSPAIGCTKYTWVTGQWGVCNSTCSIGFHNRSVSCMSYDPSLFLQSEADPALCMEAVKPENTTTCITLPCAADYSAACAVTAAPAVGHRLK